MGHLRKLTNSRLSNKITENHSKGEVMPSQRINTNAPMFPSFIQPHPRPHSFNEVLELLDDESLHKSDKGRLFEELTLAFIKIAMPDRFSEGWLWEDYPDRRGRHDRGVDIVAIERNSDRRIAIQCKFYSEGIISSKALQTFMCELQTGEFDGGIVASTRPIARNACVKLLSMGSEMWHNRHFTNSEIDWTRFSLDEPGSLKLKIRPASPKPMVGYQVKLFEHQPSLPEPSDAKEPYSAPLGN